MWGTIIQYNEGGGGDFEKRVEGAALIKWISNHIFRHIFEKV